MAEQNSIENIIDQLLGKDFEKLTTEQILQTVTGEKIDIPYEDLQSEEGFNKQLESSEKQVEELIKTLEPKDPPIPISRIEELSCNFEGDSLYAQILIESIKKDSPDLYEELKKSGALEEKYINPEDIGVKTKIPSLDKNKKLPSSGIVKFLEEKNPDFLEKTNEGIFDNLDPLTVGKPSNSGSKKKRELNILGFKIPLEFIMSGGKILHVKISGPKISIDEALDKINSTLDSQYKNSKPCDFEDDSDFLRDPEDQNEGNNLTNPQQQNNTISGNTQSVRIDAYDSNFYPEGDDPVLDQECTPGIPEDPITGDSILTKDSFDQSQQDFCDPPAYDFSGLNPDGPDPEAPPVDTDSIQACIDSALEKVDKIDKDNKLLARWSMIGRQLEEIFYHYEIIWEYQKNLADIFSSKVGPPNSGDITNAQATILALTYDDQASQIELQILKLQTQFNNSKSLFLQNNTIFTENLFNLTVLDIEKIESYSDSDIYDFIKQYSDSGSSIITYDENKKEWPIDQGVVSLKSNITDIRDILIKGNSIEILKLQKKEATDQMDQNLNLIAQKKNVSSVTIQNLESTLKRGAKGLSEETKNSFNKIFENVTSPTGYDSYGYDFVDSLKKFSVRFKEVKPSQNSLELNFELSFMNNFGLPLPYKLVKKPGKISIKSSSSEPLKDSIEPDQEKIKIGNEFAGNGGLLSGYPTNIFRNYNFIKINNLSEGQEDAGEFYDFIEKIIKTNDSKESIISDIKEKRGVLYGELIEKSSSNWLFFSAEERGDNDERDPSKLKPSSFTADGDPNPIFTDFYGNFKPKWDAKYNLNKTLFVDPLVSSIKEKSRRAAEGVAGVLPISDYIVARVFLNYFEIKKRIEQIEEIILVVAQKRQESENLLTPEQLDKQFSNINCSGASNSGGGNTTENDPENCPPPCCGPPGSDFKSGENYLLSSPPSSDCPTMFQRCWWKQFCKDVTKVGLLPYPNGLPPIEDTAYFLSGGPAVRLGLKYWPVGYLPPAFIPIPIPNPVDGLPYVRIPLPMIWTIINPIIIPLPFNLGIIVIFIPFIGGFMPTPLVYLKEFITGSSVFLTGIRGPRFIPRKSDPKIKDPLEKIKQALSFGIPDKLIPLPGFGKDNIDSPTRIITDIQKNFTKILDTIPPPGNIGDLRDTQQKEIDVKNRILSKKRDYEKRAALFDDPKPDFDQDKTELDLIVAERKNVLKRVISDYLDKGIPNPKSIYFPKDKDKLKVDTPGAVKSLRSVKDMKSSLVPIKCSGDINFKDEIREVLKLLKIITPLEYSLDNAGVSNPNKIFYKADKDPRTMSTTEFEDLVKTIRSESVKVTKILLKGNKISVNKKVRKGAFSIVDACGYQGNFAFPPIKVTNSAPKPLKFLNVPNQDLEGMYTRIMDGMSKTDYSPEDFSRYVRYKGETPSLVIRVKDLKVIISKKLGLSKKQTFQKERPLDLEEPLISKFPHPEGPLCCLESISGGFDTAISAFELPTVFPPKSDQISQTQGAGGILQTTIPGSVIKSFVVNAITGSLDTLIDDIFPEINDVNSPKFVNLQPQDIQKIVRNMIRENFNPDSPNIPDFLNIAKIPILPPARPTDMIEQTLIGMGSPPPARIVYSLFWKYFKGVPKTPLLETVVKPSIELSSKILPKIPWPLTVLLGRNIINLINPIVMSDDHPSWRRMSLKNAYYVVYIDEFLRSAADVSGLFKFFLGSADPIYPIPELQSELQKAFNTKKY